MKTKWIGMIVCAGLFAILPSRIFAEDCWVADLKLTVSGKMERQDKGKKSYHRESSTVDCKAQATFSVNSHHLVSIISQEIQGRSFHTLSAGDDCERRQTKIEGTLTEGTIGSSKKKTVYWKYESSTEYEDLCNRRSKELKKDLTSGGPIAHSWEEEDPRFKYFLYPTMSALENLCRSVQSNPKTGYCNKTPKGFSGRMRSGGKIQDAGPGKTGGEPPSGAWPPEAVYEWSVKKVPCECAASILLVRGDVRWNGVPVREGATINLEGAVIETVGRSMVKIKDQEGDQIHVGGHSTLDLSGLCGQIQQEASKPPVLKVLRGSFYYILTLGGRLKVRHIETTGVVGIRGGLEPGKIILASSSLLARDVSMPVHGTGRADLAPELDMGSAAVRNADVVLYEAYDPEEGSLLIHILKGKARLRDSSGREKSLKAGEKFYKTWSRDAKPGEFETVYVIIGG